MVKDQALKEKIASTIYSQSWIATAPVLFVFSGLDNNYGRTDATIAASYCQLSVQALGWSIYSIILILDACWVGAQPAVAKVLGDSSLSPVCVIPVGHGDADGIASRKPQKDIVEFK